MTLACTTRNRELKETKDALDSEKSHAERSSRRHAGYVEEVKGKLKDRERTLRDTQRDRDRLKQEVRRMVSSTSVMMVTPSSVVVNHLIPCRNHAPLRQTVCPVGKHTVLRQVGCRA